MTAAAVYNWWAISGLVYALAGAALFFNSAYATPAPFQSRADETPEIAMRKATAQWLDSRVGAALLVTGFFLQLTGTAGTAMLNRPAVFVLLGLAAFAAYYALSKDLIVEKFMTSSETQQQSAPRKLLQHLGDVSDVKAEPSEEVAPIYEKQVTDTAA